MKQIHVISQNVTRQTFVFHAVSREFWLDVSQIIPKLIYSEEHLSGGLPYYISSGKEGVMMPCFPGNSVGWPESLGISFHGDYLNLAGSQVRVPTERWKTEEQQCYELQSTCTRGLKI